MSLDKKTANRIIGIVFISLMLAWLVGHLDSLPSFLSAVSGLFSPLITGVFIAFIVNMPMRWIENKFFSKKWKRFEGQREKLARPISLLLSVLIFIIAIGLIIFMVMPDIIRTTTAFLQELPTTFNNLRVWFDDITIYNENPEISAIFSNFSISFNDLLQRLINWISTAMEIVVSSIVGWVQGAVSGLLNFFIGLVFSIYFLLFKEQLLREFKAVGYSTLTEGVMDRILSFGSLTNLVFSKFFSGTGLEALILGTMTFVSVMIFGFPFPTTISVITGVGAFIPIVGPFIGAIIGFILIAVEQGFMRGVFYVILIIVIEQIEYNLVYPRVVGASVGLSSFWTFAAVTFGTVFFGVSGTFLAVPVATLTYVLLEAWSKARLDQRDVSNAKVTSVRSHLAYDEEDNVSMRKTAHNVVRPTTRESHDLIDGHRVTHEESYHVDESGELKSKEVKTSTTLDIAKRNVQEKIDEAERIKRESRRLQSRRVYEDDFEEVEHEQYPDELDEG